MKPTNIDLHIETLLLRDLPYAQRYHIADAVEQELLRLLTEHGPPASLAQGGNIPHISIDSRSLPVNAQATTLGLHIAQQIYHQLQPISAENEGV